LPVVLVPVIVVDPTDSVIVHVPTAGKPLNATLPVATTHVGWVITPITGDIGNGLTVMFTAADVAGLPVGQTAFDVSTTVTASVFNGTYE
jgi:hypothetical protein